MQSRAIEDNSSSNFTPADPNIFGDIRLGIGNDWVGSSAGNIRGDIDFNLGDDSFYLTGGSFFQGAINNQDGLNLRSLR